MRWCARVDARTIDPLRMHCARPSRDGNAGNGLRETNIQVAV